MNRRFKALPLFVSMVFAGSVAHAGYVGDSATMARKIFQQNVNPNTGFAASNTNSGPMGSTETINHASNVGKNSQDAGAAANNAAGAALIATGTSLLPPPTTPTGAMLIGLGILALMQGAHDSNAADQSAATGSASVIKDGDKVQPYGTGNSAFQDPKLKQAMKTMNDLGYKVSEAGITKPDGTFIPASSLSSASSMKAAGIDANAVKEVVKVNTALADELSKYNAAGVAVSEGGGGAPANEFKPGDTEEFKSFNPFALNADAKKKLMAGKTVSLDGDPIGVSGANIFEMVHEAYQKKRSGAQFIESEEATARVPASVPPKKK